MASRSLHSHRFTLQRVIGALAMRDPNPESDPLRSIGSAALVGVLIAALVTAAVGGYGLLRPGGDNSWRTGESVIVERETGARFVFRDGVLYPVVNYSSALLILGSFRPATVMVSRGSLAGVPRGAPLGIVGAPDLLPAAEELIDGAWTLCSRPAGSGPTTDAAASATTPGPAAGAESVLFIGASTTAAPEPFGGRAMVTTDVTGGLHLLWQDRRYPIHQPDIVLAAFAWPRHSSVPVATAVLNAVPAGAELTPMVIPGRGKASGLDGHRVGEVVVVTNQSGRRQFGVITAGGVADITEVQAGLLLASGANGLDGAPKPLSQPQYAAIPHADSLIPQGEAAPPATIPELVPAGTSSVCATYSAGGLVPLLTFAPQPPTAAAEMAHLGAAAPGGSVRSIAERGTDWVALPPGRGVVVEAVAATSSPAGALALVSDLGVRYPVPSRDVLGMLGYPAQRITPVRLPTALVALLPSGPALDPAAAAVPAMPGA